MSPVVAGSNGADNLGRRHSSFAGNAPAAAATAGISLDSSGRRHSSYDGRSHGNTLSSFGRVFEGEGVGSSSGSPGGSLNGSVVQRQPSFHPGSHNGGGGAGGVGELARSVPLPPPPGGVSYSSIPGPGSLQLGAAGTVSGVVPAAVSGRSNFGKSGTNPGAAVPAGYFMGNGSASGGGAGIVSNGRRGSGVVSGGGGVGGGAVSGGVGGAAVSSGFVGGAAVSSGFVGGGRVAAAGAGSVCGGGGGGGGGAAGSAASELVGYTAQEQQLWAALSEGPDVGDGDDVEVGDARGVEVDGPGWAGRGRPMFSREQGLVGRVTRSESCSRADRFCCCFFLSRIPPPPPPPSVPFPPPPPYSLPQTNK